MLAKDGLVQFPTVMGGVVTVVNIAGVEPTSSNTGGVQVTETDRTLTNQTMSGYI